MTGLLTSEDILTRSIQNVRCRKYFRHTRLSQLIHVYFTTYNMKIFQSGIHSNFRHKDAWKIYQTRENVVQNCID